MFWYQYVWSNIFLLAQFDNATMKSIHFSKQTLFFWWATLAYRRRPFMGRSRGNSFSKQCQAQKSCHSEFTISKDCCCHIARSLQICKGLVMRHSTNSWFTPQRGRPDDGCATLQHRGVGKMMYWCLQMEVLFYSCLVNNHHTIILLFLYDFYS